MEASIRQLKASVRVLGDALDPDEVTQLLGVRPTHAHRKGDVSERPTGNIQQRTGAWVLQAKSGISEEWDLDGLVNQLLDQVPASQESWRKVTERFKTDVFCGLFMSSDNEGFDLNPGTLERLARCGLRLAIDIYAPFI